ncbi:MAG: hypothetical protein HYR73_05660 [Candidatus Eisenbacteria bacterium]|nr:hypothetical protein [Candidatus Eisenbacteria bacterium]
MNLPTRFPEDPHFKCDVPTNDGILIANPAFVQLDDVVKRGAMNLKAGEFMVEAPYLSDSRPARLQNYLSQVSLPARGLELNGSAAAWTYGTGLVDSQRRRGGAEAETRWLGRLEDSYLWLIRDLHGQRIGARMLFDRQDSNLPFHSWLQHLQAQASALLDVGRVEVVPAYTLDRFDDRPAAGLHQRRQTALLEGRALLGAERRWVVTMRAEHEYVTRTAFSREEDHHQEAFEFGYDLRPNAELAVEWANAGDNIHGAQVDHVNAYVRFGY